MNDIHSYLCVFTFTFTSTFYCHLTETSVCDLLFPFSKINIFLEGDGGQNILCFFGENAVSDGKH